MKTNDLIGYIVVNEGVHDVIDEGLYCVEDSLLNRREARELKNWCEKEYPNPGKYRIAKVIISK